MKNHNDGARDMALVLFNWVNNLSLREILHGASNKYKETRLHELVKS